MFLHQILRTRRFKTLGEENMQGSAGQQRVPTDFLKNFPIGIPPKSEQIIILDLIQEINTQTDLIISKAQKEISSIKEYREALITDLVTGKRKVDNVYNDSNNDFAVAAEGAVAYGNVKGFSQSFNKK